ncbi:MAG: PLDc N-terminal domain-containing protein [Phycisphaerales bacterium]|nr:PLDc N-terminal domain-containing protein [Phycisphaerales bacterium]
MTPLTLAWSTGYGIVGLVILILDIIALVSVLGGRGSVGHKLLWTLLVILLPLLGMILYFAIGRSAADA